MRRRYGRRVPQVPQVPLPWRTVPYGSDSPRQLLDLHVPDGPGPHPVVVAVHGGAFRAGDRTGELDALPALLAHGYAVAAVGYRLSGEAVFPAAVQDVKRAVAHLRHHAGELDLDAERFAAWGRSAGAYLAVMAGATGGRRTPFDTVGADSSVAAVVGWYGPSDFSLMDAQLAAAPPRDGTPVMDHGGADSPESRFLGAPLAEVPGLVQSANPVPWLRAAPVLPAFWLAAGSEDPLVPHQQTVLVVEELVRRRADVTFRLLPGVGHAGPEFERRLTAPVLAWLDEVLRR